MDSSVGNRMETSTARDVSDAGFGSSSWVTIAPPLPLRTADRIGLVVRLDGLSGTGKARARMHRHRVQGGTRIQMSRTGVNWRGLHHTRRSGVKELARPESGQHAPAVPPCGGPRESRAVIGFRAGPQPNNAEGNEPVIREFPRIAANGPPARSAPAAWAPDWRRGAGRAGNASGAGRGPGPGRADRGAPADGDGPLSL